MADMTWEFHALQWADGTAWHPAPPPGLPDALTRLAGRLRLRPQQGAVRVLDAAGRGWRLDWREASVQPGIRGAVVHLAEESQWNEAPAPCPEAVPRLLGWLLLANSGKVATLSKGDWLALQGGTLAGLAPTGHAWPELLVIAPSPDFASQAAAASVSWAPHGETAEADPAIDAVACWLRGTDAGWSVFARWWPIRERWPELAGTPGALRTLLAAARALQPLAAAHAPLRLDDLRQVRETLRAAGLAGPDVAEVLESKDLVAPDLLWQGQRFVLRVPAIGDLDFSTLWGLNALVADVAPPSWLGQLTARLRHVPVQVWTLEWWWQRGLDLGAGGQQAGATAEDVLRRLVKPNAGLIEARDRWMPQLLDWWRPPAEPPTASEQDLLLEVFLAHRATGEMPSRFLDLVAARDRVDAAIKLGYSVHVHKVGGLGLHGVARPGGGPA